MKNVQNLLSQKGFIVTHTGPIGDFVEIGIEPYNEANDAIIVMEGKL